MNHPLLLSGSLVLLCGIHDLIQQPLSDGILLSFNGKLKLTFPPSQQSHPIEKYKAILWQSEESGVECEQNTHTYTDTQYNNIHILTNCEDDFHKATILAQNRPWNYTCNSEWKQSQGRHRHPDVIPTNRPTKELRFLLRHNSLERTRDRLISISKR